MLFQEIKEAMARQKLRPAFAAADVANFSFYSSTLQAKLYTIVLYLSTYEARLEGDDFSAL